MWAFLLAGQCLATKGWKAFFGDTASFRYYLICGKPRDKSVIAGIGQDVRKSERDVRVREVRNDIQLDAEVPSNEG